MSEPPPPSSPAFVPARLQGLQPGVFALAWVSPGAPSAATPRRTIPGLAGADRPGFALERLVLADAASGPSDALRRWTELDLGEMPLVLIMVGPEGQLREYSPGELAAQLVRQGEDLTDMLGAWLARRMSAARSADEAWTSAGAAWALHLRDLAVMPSGPVLDAAMAVAAEADTSVARHVGEVAGRLSALFSRLHQPQRRDQLEQDWVQLPLLTQSVPELQETTGWLLDQLALNYAPAQRLRAILEPDLSDYHRDVAAAAASGAALPVLDEQRAAQLAWAQETVREYTAAHFSGRTGYAHRLLEAAGIPRRTHDLSWGARTWRDASADAAEAVEQLHQQRDAAFAQDGPLAEPEAVHASRAYLDVRAAMLDQQHDALGQLTSLPSPGTIPEPMRAIAAAQALAGVTQAFGTLERAREFLDGRIAYLQQPLPHRAAEPAELHRLQTVRETLDQLVGAPFAEQADSIRERVQAITTRPAAVTSRATVRRGTTVAEPLTPPPAPGVRR